MRVRWGSFVPFVLVVLLCVAAPAVSAWSVTDITVKPSAGPLAPGTAVTVSFTVRFDAWADGETFDSAHSLDIYTELDNARWSATLVDSDPGDGGGPVATTLEPRQAIRYSVDGSTLGGGSERLDLTVRLTGTAPDAAGTQDKVAFRIRELDADSDEVSGAIHLVKFTVAGTAPVETKTARTTATSRAATTLPATAAPDAVTTPAAKQTYSPGPGPVAIAGALALAGTALSAGKRKGDR